jgi:hypothetical protein
MSFLPESSDDLWAMLSQGGEVALYAATRLIEAGTPWDEIEVIMTNETSAALLGEVVDTTGDVIEGGQEIVGTVVDAAASAVSILPVVAFAAAAGAAWWVFGRR